MFTSSWLMDAQLGVLATTRMNREYDIARIIINIDDDPGNQCPQQLLAGTHRNRRVAVHAADRLSARLVKALAIDLLMLMAFQRAGAVPTIPDTPSAGPVPVFSIARQMRRLSGSQAA